VKVIVAALDNLARKSERERERGGWLGEKGREINDPPILTMVDFCSGFPGAVVPLVHHPFSGSPSSMRRMIRDFNPERWLDRVETLKLRVTLAKERSPERGRTAIGDIRVW